MVSYYKIMIFATVCWIFISLMCILLQNKNKENEIAYGAYKKRISLSYLFDKISKNKIVSLIIIILWLILFVCYGQLHNDNIKNMIKYEDYCFQKKKDDEEYNSIENYFHNRYLKDVSLDKLNKLHSDTEGYNMFTISDDFKFDPDSSDNDNNLNSFIEDVKKICNKLKNEIYDYKKYDRLDFIKLIRIFLNNECIHKGKKTFRIKNENDLHKDFNFLFNMNDKVIDQASYNIDNVLIGAFPLEFVYYGATTLTFP